MLSVGSWARHFITPNQSRCQFALPRICDWCAHHIGALSTARHHRCVAASWPSFSLLPIACFKKDTSYSGHTPKSENTNPLVPPTGRADCGVPLMHTKSSSKKLNGQFLRDSSRGSTLSYYGQKNPNAIFLLSRKYRVAFVASTKHFDLYLKLILTLLNNE